MKKKEKKENNKPKEKKEKIFTIYKILRILNLLSLVFLVFTFMLVGKLEKGIIIFGSISLFIINILIFMFLKSLINKKKITRYIFVILVTLLITFMNIFLGYYIHRTYSLVSNISKDTIEYSSSLVVLKDSKIDELKDLKKNTIGILDEKNSIDYYILPNNIIKTNKLKSNNTIKEYKNETELLSDLYDGKLDAIFVSQNYTNKFSNIKGYEKISEETKIVYTYSKSYTKKQIAKLTKDNTLASTNANITEPFTVLLMGVDSGGETLNNQVAGNGDSLMVVTFNPKTLNATILSIPRDSYVPIMCFANNRENKITHAAWNGEGCIIKTIENFTGIKIDYYAKINFKGVVRLVDALGGIEVDVPVEFCEQDSNRSFGNLQCLKEGKQTLNGEQALALARHRKTLLTGDLQRGLNQQLVIKGILNRAKNIRSANEALTLLENMSKYIDTNFTTDQILSFYNLGKQILLTSSSDNIINIDQLYLSGSTQGIYDESMGLVLSDYIINQSSLNQVVRAMKKNLGIEKNEIQKHVNFNIEEIYEKEIVGTENLSATKMYSLLSNLQGSSLNYAKSYLEAHNIPYKVEYKNVSSGYYENQVISQSYPQSKRIDLITSPLILTVAQLNKTEEPSEPLDNEDLNENPNVETEPGNENNPDTPPTTDENIDTNENTDETNE